MPLFSAFSVFGHYALSSRKPPGQLIYESLLAGEGGVFNDDFDSAQGARRYAQAMCLASAKLQIDRAANNRIPSKATELIPELERDYQVTPSYTATIQERRNALASRVRLTRGARAESLEEALRLLLGDDFISLEPLSGASILTFPGAPGTVGAFASAGAKKKAFQIQEAISVLGAQTVHWSAVGSSEAPIVGETFTVDPNICGRPELVTVTAITSTTLTASFTKSHEPGTLAVRPHPLWTSTRRYNLITLTPTAAQNPEKRRQVNELMARMLRGVSQWGIVSNNGYFQLNTPGRCVLSSTKLA
jgi:hypothetical protein